MRDPAARSFLMSARVRRCSTAIRASVIAVAVLGILVAAGCSQTPEAVAPTTTAGPSTQDAYLCSDPTPCRPAVGWVTQEVTPSGATRGQLARFYIDNLGGAGWMVEAAYCDEDKNEYAVVASRQSQATSGYEGRFELSDKAKVEAKITVPAFGQENAFTVEPDPSAYPAGPCSDAIVQAVARARQAIAPATTAPGTP